MRQNDQVCIGSSYSCGYRKVFDEYSQIIQTKYPYMNVNGSNYNPPGLYMLLSRLIVRIPLLTHQTTHVCADNTFNCPFSLTDSSEDTGGVRNPGGHEHLSVHQPAAAALVDVVHRKQALRLHDGVFLLQHPREPPGPVGRVRNLGGQRARVVQARDGSHSAARRAVPDHRQPHAVQHRQFGRVQ